MSNAVLVMGKTGSGKSTSMENLDPKETFIINVVGKDLPFRGGNKRYTAEKKNYFATHNHAQIVGVMKELNKNAPHVKTIIVDDAQYIMSYEFMTTKTSGFDKFNEIAEHMFGVIKITLEGLFTVVLMAEQRVSGEETIYGFQTKGTVRDTVKTPKDMFKDEYIPNDLKLVVDTIEEYNNAE